MIAVGWCCREIFRIVPTFELSALFSQIWNNLFLKPMVLSFAYVTIPPGLTVCLLLWDWFWFYYLWFCYCVASWEDVLNIATTSHLAAQSTVGNTIHRFRYKLQFNFLINQYIKLFEYCTLKIFPPLRTGNGIIDTIIPKDRNQI